MPLIAALAICVVAALVAAVLHPIVFPLDEAARDLDLDEQLHQVAASGANALREEGHA